MSDMLVKLYDLPPISELENVDDGPVIRKPIGAEHRVAIAWVLEQFGDAWASEAQAALANRPVSAFVAIRQAELLGFACYDATLRGMFGPIGVAQEERSRGIGQRLLRACLDDMRSVGYGYAVIGGAASAEFFRRGANAVEIADSEPGVYRGMLKSPAI